ncbi:MAG: acyl-CoA synthetase, long-chain fatty acid:CoA ligase [Microbacteriaceae bacterium]|nr:acyl-CoA synthetase, long-chain fatty acid:CoA ligase [Microbacteriaceae bacterium]
MTLATGTWSAMILESMTAGSERVMTISSNGEAWTGQEFLERAAGASQFLDAAGSADGSPVAMIMADSPTAQAFLFAGSATNRPLAPLSTRMTAHELAAIVGPLNVKLLFAARSSEALGRETAALCGIELVIVDELARSTETVEWRAGLESLGYILHTSGTTGHPKAVLTSQRSLAARARLMIGLYHLDTTSVFAATSPLHHIAGLGIVALVLASDASLVSFPSFTVEAWKKLTPLKVTHVATIATVVEMLMNADAFELPTLRMLSYGASASRAATILRMMAQRPDVEYITWYGQTEGSPMAYLSPEQHRYAADGHVEVLDSVGTAVPGGKVMIHEPDSSGVGEIWAKAPHMVVVNASGWRESGDLGRMDENGRLHIVGRKGDMIIRGGENIYPIEVERVLGEHPAVQEAVVVGIPDDRLGETVKAYIRPMHLSSLPDTEDLRSFTRERLAGFKVPVEWTFLETIPRNASGKVVRRALASAPAIVPLPAG